MQVVGKVPQGRNGWVPATELKKKNHQKNGNENHWLRREGSKDRQNAHLEIKLKTCIQILEARYNTFNFNLFRINVKRNFANYPDVSNELKVRYAPLFFSQESNMS